MWLLIVLIGLMFLSAPVAWQEKDKGMKIVLYVVGIIAIILGILAGQGILP
jgi:hypothetical protein